MTGSNWEWSEQKYEAVRLLADQTLSIAEISQRVGVSRATLWEWRQMPQFQEELRRVLAQIREEVARLAIADRYNRVADLDAIRSGLLRVKAERAAWFLENEPGVPGGQTGLILKRHKVVGAGKDAIAIPEYEIDAALIDGLREVNKQAAIETCQWQEDEPGQDAATAIPPTVIVFGEQQPRQDAIKAEVVEGGHRPLTVEEEKALREAKGGPPWA